MSSREENIEKIRAACIAVNPGIFSKECPTCEYDGLWNKRYTEDKGYRPIRLADVLLAIIRGKTKMYLQLDLGIGQVGFVAEAQEIGREYWNLFKDDLTQQSDECLAFIASLV